MKPWKKEALVCVGYGAGIVGVLFGVGALFGGGFGSCGPTNGVEFLMLLAVLPGLPFVAMLPSGLADSPVGGVIIIGVSIIVYACLVLTVRWTWGFLKSMRSRHDRGAEAWPFDQPENCAVFTTTHVLKEGRDIVRVFHDADDHGWQFHCAGDVEMKDAMLVSLAEMVRHDPSITEVADLPPGWQAWRKGKGDAWQRAKMPTTGES